MNALLLLALIATAPEPASLVDAVNPFIGTGGHGHTYPGASVPFGMVQLSPDTRLTGWDGCSGYHYTDDVVYGFSHTHLSGTGVSDYGDILFMPVSGEPHLNNGADRGTENGYASHFDKERETASPGFYSTYLTDYDIEVELSATARAGLHRYRLPSGKPSHVVLDLAHRDQVLESRITVVSDTEIAGFRRSTAWAVDQVVYFSAQFSRPFKVRLAENDEFVEGVQVEGTNCKAVLDFGWGGGEIMIRVGISAVDIDGARSNVQSEIPRFEMPAVRESARAAWAQALDRFRIEGATEDETTIFATALYHSFLAPNLFSDIDGRYRGMDGATHTAEGRNHYTVFSLWDTYRATHPLLTIVEPDRTQEFLEVFLAQYQQGGRLPVWELAANETDCMIGYHSVSVIADAWTKGLTTDDGEALLEAMLDSARRDHFGLESYQRDGFISVDYESESVSKTLEYAYDDWCIARMADALGKNDIAAEFDLRAQAWRHLFDPRTGFMRPRQNGGWMKPWDPRQVDFHHTEANGWQYRFAVPHDVEGFIDAIGGEERFVAALDSLFEVSSETTGRDQADITGQIGQYAHGNEPSHHMGWLYHFAGRPDQSARRIDRIRREMYSPEPDGLIGNEDCGQMSSWYVFAAMGLYPVAPGDRQYVIVPPAYESLSVDLPDGGTFTVRREGEGTFVESATWNGAALERSFILHEEIVGGGELVIRTAAAPSAWGQAEEHRPRSRVEGPRITTAAWIESNAESFRDSLVVRAGCDDPDASFEWRSGDRVEQGPEFVVRESGEVFLSAIDAAGQSGPAVRAEFWHVPHDWTVSVESEVNLQYTAGGPQALLDTRRGPEDWRTGAWQGYEGQDFSAVVDFGDVQSVSAASAGFLQDQRSWILMPTEVTFEIGDLNHNYREVLRVTHDVGDRWSGVHIRDLGGEFEPVEGRYLRVRARNYGRLPDWHLGAGGETFIFIDEIHATAEAIAAEPDR
jgi:predicted alpha-1,2-mannosidase